MEVAISKKRQFGEVKKMVWSRNTEGIFKMIGPYDTLPKNHHGIYNKNIPCIGNDKEWPYLDVNM